MSAEQAAYPNATLINNVNLSTVQTRPLAWATVDYIPSLAGNPFYLAVPYAVLVIQSILGIHYRSLVALFLGVLGEIVGYVAQVQMAQNPFLRTPFLM